ncbi:MAG: T9SS type A sorting domain-containing protein [Chitinophagaceae bacterium]|nr:MAG: T9SS type A sorting domain-containing protein [Chitinophagaceae bacterium]
MHLSLQQLKKFLLSRIHLKILWFFFFIACIAAKRQLYAQRTCGTPLAIKQALEKNPKLLEKYSRIKSLAVPPARMQEYLRGQAVVVVPVVVHIVLQNPNSISDAQVQSQINVLNEDYDADNADSATIPGVWKSLFGDMRIQFCLAERTPGGNPSDGIDRVTTTQPIFSINNAVSTVKHASSGGADAWDPSKYLNIWICNLSDNTLGVGTPPVLYPDDEEGVVIQYNAFGTIGNLLPAFNEGRTATHEIGHYFNLLHPWGDGDGSCSPGDSVADTPPESQPVYGCPAFPYLQDQCSTNYPGVMFNNFMGYANDSCMDMFTDGQVARAQAAFFAFRSSLLTSDGCQPVILKNLDARLQGVASPHGKICDNEIAPVVTLKNMGKDTLTSVNISYQLNHGTVQTFAWTGTLPSLDTVQLALPATSVQTGNYLLTAYTSQPNGQADEQLSNDTATAGFHLDPLATVPFTEGFEEDSFPPPGWEILNDVDSISWQKTHIASHSGQYSVVMRNFDFEANGPASNLITPVFNLTNADSAFLSFYVAAAIQSDPSGNNQYWDTLEVLISTDCGQSGTVLYKKWGINLITDSTPTSQGFVPTASQWRKDSINLAPYIKQGNFQIIFKCITNFENNIYLDDINLATRQTNPILKEQKVLVVPNPTNGELTVQFLGNPPDLKAVSVYNVSGQLLYRKFAAAINDQNRMEFDLSGVPDGIYFIKVSYTDHQMVKKIIKIK